MAFLPSSASVKACVELSTSGEAAAYFSEALQEKLKKEKVEGQFGELIGNVTAFAESREQASFAGDPWSGTYVERTEFEGIQAKAGEEAAKMFADKEVTFDFAIGDKAEILRGYSSNGQALDEEESHTLDKLFNSWLANNGMLTKDGVIYEATAKGEIEQDSKGKNKAADAERVRELVTDKKNSFAQYAKSKNKTTTIIPVAHDHPDYKKSSPSAAPAA